MSESEKPTGQKVGRDVTFHWRYIIFPVAILVLSVVIVAYFYCLLPAEVSYHFRPDGSPDRWLSRSVIVLWMLVPQFFLTLLAAALTWGMTRLAVRFRQAEGGGGKAGSLLSLMGNMIALPQVILGFAMLDIFSYNAYQVHLMSLLTFTLIVMGVGTIILGIFFIRAIRQVMAES
jgi:uncharacterized membrane protein